MPNSVPSPLNPKTQRVKLDAETYLDLKKVRSFIFKKTGSFLTDSEVANFCVRATPLSPKLLDVLEEIDGEESQRP